ncbi:sugar phosphate isomerase/epimerase [Vibrio sp. Of14-4]|uniref:sugar phosphate isomerase/epimerase family protein n=1 Tax=Vibrio sp. Of14-4 TaxID=2724878 RepID=UPI001EF247F6|nr:TIM barrel protein [Vibrio sp. Of14-4]MCG7489652.1 sugar phosphate isomerase/epimerase [Vibrio sp. Of14-4]
MIYISSSCVKNDSIKNSVSQLANAGFKNIELSGGTELYDGFELDLLELRDKYKLNYLCHNYFPPPKEHFVLNLASLSDEIFDKSIEHLTKSIQLSQRLGAKKFGFHAGFFIDIKVKEIGKKISKDKLFDKEQSIMRFKQGYKRLLEYSDGVDLYIENNVFSSTNHITYKGENIFMLTESKEFNVLNSEMKFNLLLDVAHLKVSAKTLGLNFEEEFSLLFPKSSYIHLSDNDGFHDLNLAIKKDSDLSCLLKKFDTKNKDFTLEVYESIDKIKETYDLIQGVVE